MHLVVRALLSLVMATAVTAQGKNLLFYGNSYTYFSWGYGVPELVGLIAAEAGHAPPTIVQALIGGSNLQIHANDPAQVAVIYQTWARAWGHMYYPAPWPVPIDMHNMVRGNYDLAVQDINMTYGAGSAAKAAVGDAVALLEWNPSWYDPDLSHPGPAMTLLAAMCIYTTIYGQTTCEIDPDFTPGSPLETSLTPHAIDRTIWNHLVGLADRSAVPAVRRYPGSGDHLLLETATGPNPLTACPTKHMTTGTPMQIQLRSMNGVYDGALGWLLVDFFATGSPPGPFPGLPELQVDLGRVILSPAASLSSPLSVAFQMPFSLPGGSFLVQGIAWQPSAESGNPLFTATDAHELVFF